MSDYWRTARMLALSVLLLVASAAMPYPMSLLCLVGSLIAVVNA